jgi:hypothetical protein
MKTTKELVHDIRSQVSSLKMAIDLIESNQKEEVAVSMEMIDLILKTNDSLHRDLTGLCNSLKSG